VERKFSLHDVPGDGSCMYHAVAFGINFLQTKKIIHMDEAGTLGHALRQRLTQYVKDNDASCFMMNFLPKILAGTPQYANRELSDYDTLVENFLARLENHESFGGVVELHLLSRLLNVQFVTNEVKEDYFCQRTTADEARLPRLAPIIHLLYQHEGSHYLCMLPNRGPVRRIANGATNAASDPISA
jgi:hypothetical protein